MLTIIGLIQKSTIQGPYKDGSYKLSGQIESTEQPNRVVQFYQNLSSVQINELNKTLAVKDGDLILAHLESDGLLLQYELRESSEFTSFPTPIPLTEVELMKEAKTITLRGKIFYPHLFVKNQMSEKYQIDLSIDAATKKTVESLGVLVKNKVTGANVKTKDPTSQLGDFITLRSTTPPTVVDSKKNTIDPQTKVGYGSTATVVGNIYPWKKGSGNSIGLSVVQITNLIPVTSTSATEMLKTLEETEGFDVNATTDEDGA